MKIKKLIIPAAGRGTRFLPFTKAVPKELVPVLDKPILQVVIEEAAQSGIEEIIIVISPDKKVIQDYFTPDARLVELLKSQGKKDQAKAVSQIEKLPKIHYTFQKKPLGNGHAVLCADKYIYNDEFFAVVWADEYYHSKTPRLRQIMDAAKKYNKATLSLLRSPEGKFEKWCSKYGNVGGKEIEKDIIQINEIIEKPSPDKALSKYFSFGGYILPGKIMNILRETKPGKSGEIWLADAIEKLALSGELIGKVIEGECYDFGNKAGFVAGNVAVGLEDPVIAPELKEMLRKLIK